MARLPSLGSLRSIANAYDEDEISDDEELSKLKKRKLSATEETARSESKGEESEPDIVVSDEEGGSSGAGSMKNAVVISEPKVTKGSRLVSYAGDEDEDDDIKNAEESEMPVEDEAVISSEALAQGSLKNEDATQPLEEGSQNAEDQPVASTHKSLKTREMQENKEMLDLPQELQDHLAAVKAIEVTLPEEPDGRCSNSLQEKIENLLQTKQRTGRDLKHTIQRKKNFRNPSIYEKLLSFCSINEIGTNYPPHIYDPFSWTEDSYYERLGKIQKEHHEKKQRERSKVEFKSATKKTVTTADDASKKRKSKWDVTSSGTATLTIPPSAMQQIASVQALAANASKLGTGNAVQVKKT